MRISPITSKPKFNLINFSSTKRTTYETESQKVVVKPFYDKSCDFLGHEYGRILVSNSTRFSTLVAYITVLHVACFGEAMELLRQKLNKKNVYYMNPAFDM